MPGLILFLDFNAFFDELLAEYLSHDGQDNFALFFGLEPGMDCIERLLNQCVGLIVGSEVEVMHEVSVLLGILLHYRLYLLGGFLLLF